MAAAAVTRAQNRAVAKVGVQYDIILCEHGRRGAGLIIIERPADFRGVSVCWNSGCSIFLIFAGVGETTTLMPIESDISGKYYKCV